MENPFEIEDWTADPRGLRLGRQGETGRVSHKVMAVLAALAERPGQVLSKEELIAAAWDDGSFASDEALSTVVYELRKALGDDARKPRYVETIPKRGYRLIATVRPAARPPEHTTEHTTEPPPGQTPGNPWPAPEDAAPLGPIPPASPRRRRRWLPAPALGIGLLGIVLLALGLFTLGPRWSGGEAPGSEAPVGGGSVEKGPGTAETPGPIRSLAVLPMSTFSEEYREDFFADGLTEMLTAQLAFDGTFAVTPSLAVRGPEPWSLERASEELAVDAVVEATVLRSGDRLWISVQLVELASGRLRWGSTYERLVGDPLATQKELAQEIAAAVRAQASGG